jgi:uncharacterized lipoprotein YbaY
MRTIKGTIVSKTTGLLFEPNTTARVQVIDCSLACAPSKKLGETILTNLSGFPLSFQVEFNEEPQEADRPIIDAAVQVRIETGERLDYINDTRFSIKNRSNDEFKDFIEVHVIPVRN